MQIGQLKQVLEIARQGNISKAAECLYISQPSLSESLNRLEKELSVQIFERNRKGVTPTEDGKHILESIEKIIREIDYLENYSEKDKGLTGKITLYYTANWSDVAEKIWLEFQQKFPEATLNLYEGEPNDITQHLLRESNSYGLIRMFPSFDDEYFGKADMLHFEKSNRTFHAMMYCSKNLRARLPQDVTLGDFHDYQVLLYRKNTHLNNRILHILKNGQLQLAPIFLDDKEQIKRLIIQQDMCAIMPSNFMENDIEKDSMIISLNLRETQTDREAGLMYVDVCERNLLNREFIQLVRKHMNA